MAEVVAKAGVTREEGYLYFIDQNGDVARVTMSRGGAARKKKAAAKKAKKGTKKTARGAKKPAKKPAKKAAKKGKKGRR